MDLAIETNASSGLHLRIRGIMTTIVAISIIITKLIHIIAPIVIARRIAIVAIVIVIAIVMIITVAILFPIIGDHLALSKALGG